MEIPSRPRGVEIVVCGSLAWHFSLRIVVPQQMQGNSKAVQDQILALAAMARLFGTCGFAGSETRYKLR